MKNIFSQAELYHPVKQCDEKLCICETCHKHYSKMKFRVKQSAIKWY